VVLEKRAEEGDIFAGRLHGLNALSECCDGAGGGCKSRGYVVVCRVIHYSRDGVLVCADVVGVVVEDFADGVDV
jgi:hypothetical protein